MVSTKKFQQLVSNMDSDCMTIESLQMNSLLGSSISIIAFSKAESDMT